MGDYLSEFLLIPLTQKPKQYNNYEYHEMALVTHIVQNKTTDIKTNYNSFKFKKQTKILI